MNEKQEQIIKRTATRSTWNQLIQKWEDNTLYRKPRFTTEIRHCYLCRCKRRATSLTVNGKYESFSFTPLRLNLFELDLGSGEKYGFYLCDECCVLLGIFSDKTTSQLILNDHLPFQKI